MGSYCDYLPKTVSFTKCKRTNLADDFQFVLASCWAKPFKVDKATILNNRNILHGDSKVFISLVLHFCQILMYKAYRH